MLFRSVAWFTGRVRVDSGPSALIGLSSGFSSTLDAGSSVLLSPVVEDLALIAGERRATCRVRQVAWFAGRVHVDSGPSALVGLSSRFSATLDASSSVLLSPVVEDLALVAASSWSRRRR